jgi:hypothetical protein
LKLTLLLPLFFWVCFLIWHQSRYQMAVKLMSKSEILYYFYVLIFTATRKKCNHDFTVQPKVVKYKFDLWYYYYTIRVHIGLLLGIYVLYYWLLLIRIIILITCNCFFSPFLKFCILVTGIFILDSVMFNLLSNFGESCGNY